MDLDAGGQDLMESRSGGGYVFYGLYDSRSWLQAGLSSVLIESQDTQGEETALGWQNETSYP